MSIEERPSPPAELLAAFVPRGLISDALRADEEGEAFRFEAALLFVDIVNSTGMTDHAAQGGQEAVERFAEKLSAYFSRCIGTIEACGGEVFRIDGDAVIAVWRASGCLRRAVGLAAAAASQLARWPDELDASTDLSIRHRVAVDCGTLGAFILGSPGARRFLVLTGAPLKRIGAGALRGGPGEVIVSEAGARHLASSAHVEPRSGAVRLLSAPAVDPPPAAPPRPSDTWADFAPQAVRAHVKDDQLRWLPEFRRVSAAYLKLIGVRGSSSAGRARLRTAFAIAQAVLGDLNITLTDVIEDDKGFLLKLTCGLPPNTPANQALVAASAAVRLSAALREAGVSVAAGVAGGAVFCGVVGDASRREYIAIGPAMNYGARLMQHAGSGVLCDDATAIQIQAAFRLGPRRELAVAGAAAPLGARRVIARRGRPLRVIGNGAELLGRSPEQAVIDERLEATGVGQASALGVEGLSGSGKSRLLAYAADAARARGLRPITVAAESIERSTPFFVLRAVLIALYGSVRATDLRQAVAEALAGDPLRQRLALLQDIMPLGFEPVERLGELEGAARRLATQELIQRLVELASGPVALLVDDVQWIDGASAEVLRGLTRAGRVLVIAAARSDPSPPDRLHWSEWPKLTLRPLGRGDVAELVRARLDADHVPRRLVDFVCFRSQGLPLYAEQLTLALRERGLIRVVDGRCRIVDGGLAADETPAELDDIVVSRVDVLSAPDRTLLKIASVIAAEFDLGRLAALAERPVRQVKAAVARLVAAGFLARVGPARLTFHPVVRESVYRLLTFNQRRALHRTIAQMTEREPGAAIFRASELAEHWERAGEPDAAIGYRLEAGQFALDRYANEQALEHLTRASELAAAERRPMSAEHRLQASRIRADACQELSRFDDARAAYEDCAGILRLRMPQGRGVMAARAAVLFARRTLAPPRPSANRSRGSTERDRLMAHILERIAEHAYFENDTARVLYCTLSSLHHAERAGAAREITVGYGGLAIGLGLTGLDGMARAYADRCLAAADRGNAHDQALARLLTSAYGFSAGRWTDTARWCREGASRFTVIGETFRRQSCEVVGAYVDLATGDRAAAVKALQAYGPAARAVDNGPVRAWIVAARAALAVEQNAGADRALAELSEVMKDDLHTGERLLCEGMAASLLYACGDLAAARAACERGLRSMQADPPSIGIGYIGVSEIGRILVEMSATSDRDPTLVRDARAACRAVGSYAGKIQVARPRALLIRGSLALAEERRRAATAAWTRALQESTRLRMPEEADTARRLLSCVQQA